MDKRVMFLSAGREYAAADIVLQGVPFDGTSCGRKGADIAPDAIRQASDLIETYSPYQQLDLEDLTIADMADIEIPREEPLAAIEHQADKTFDIGAKPLFFGGEHSVAIPLVKAALKKYPNLFVLILDAHCDLRDIWDETRFSHACVSRRIGEIVGWNKLKVMGARSGTREEFDFGGKLDLFVEFSSDQLSETASKLAGKPLYISLDIDIFDPSIVPGTGTPEPGGINYRQFLDLVQRFQGLNFIAGDIVELCPPADISGVSSVVTASCAREMMLMLSKKIVNSEFKIVNGNLPYGVSA